MMAPSDTNNNAPPARSENVLYRSRIEIGRILRELAAAGCTVSAELGDGKQFVSRMLAADPDAGYFFIGYGANKYLNSVLFRQSSLEFTASHLGAHLAFQVSNPADSLFNGQPALRFAFPASLILYHRRERPRIPVSAEVSLRCVADDGGILSFETRIVDISLDGMASMLYDKDINLEIGTILKGNRIIIPGGKAIIADLEVRHITKVLQPDGTMANRAGLRFIKSPDEIAQLINIFIQNLDDPAPAGIKRF